MNQKVSHPWRRIAYVGSVPADEAAYQSTLQDFSYVNRVECETYRKQLVRGAGHEPKGCRLSIMSSSDGLVNYLEVALKIFQESDEVYKYFDAIEATSSFWDATSLAELVSALAHLGINTHTNRSLVDNWYRSKGCMR